MTLPPPKQKSVVLKGVSLWDPGIATKQSSAFDLTARLLIAGSGNTATIISLREDRRSENLCALQLGYRHLPRRHHWLFRVAGAEMVTLYTFSLPARKSQRAAKGAITESSTVITPFGTRVVSNNFLGCHLTSRASVWRERAPRRLLLIMVSCRARVGDRRLTVHCSLR